jgi:Spy/CpxP family protein refolding chaperone
MKAKTIAAALVITGFAAITVMAQAPGPQGRGRGPGGPGGPGGPNVLAMVRQLDLSDTQREQVRQIMEEGRQNTPGQALRDAERKLHEALLADTPDAGSVEALKSAVNAAHAAELDQRIAMIQRVAQILTPVQREQLLKLRPQGPPRGH